MKRLTGIWEDKWSRTQKLIEVKCFKSFRRLLLGEHVLFICKLSAGCLRLLYPIADVMFSIAKGCLIKQNRAFLMAIDKQIKAPSLRPVF